jgi:orotate phosphoribosyltransferase
VSAREDLLAILVRRSYLREEGRQFRLASGRMSDYYIECSLTTTYHAALPLIGELVHETVPARAVAIGGPTMGADPIAAATAYRSAGTSRPLGWFSVRKTAKEHGARRWLEGSVERGDAVVVVEDVITSGGSIVDAVRKCREEGLEIVGGVVLVDREEDDGRARVERAFTEVGAPFHALFTRRDLEAAWQARRAAR